jgi:TRAP-type uncharacterized transport system substrate-binding protein
VVADKARSGRATAFELLVRGSHLDSGRFKTFKDLKGMKIAVGFGGSNSSAINGR